MTLAVKVALNPNTTNQSKLKDFADNNFKFDENVKKFPKRVKNAVGKEEIAFYEQFLLLQKYFCNSIFKRLMYCRHIKIRACLGKGEIVCSRVFSRYRVKSFVVKEKVKV